MTDMILPAREVRVGDRVRPLSGRAGTKWYEWWGRVVSVRHTSPRGGRGVMEVEHAPGVPLDRVQPWDHGSKVLVRR